MHAESSSPTPGGNLVPGPSTLRWQVSGRFPRWMVSSGSKEGRHCPLLLKFFCSAKTHLAQFWPSRFGLVERDGPRTHRLAGMAFFRAWGPPLPYSASFGPPVTSSIPACRVEPNNATGVPTAPRAGALPVVAAPRRLAALIRHAAPWPRVPFMEDEARGPLVKNLAAGELRSSVGPFSFFPFSVLFFLFLFFLLLLSSSFT